ncbi:MFS transporter [Burkholderia sp. Bp9142]|uniref:MFS transporter n=1 Tax=Burkholderia sp. Bp9142 TaxID=2184573 RepID=UPI000F591351|nr:MFS transporter [Burkholderia sp. Bp9142]RQR27031.1 MFS transporter [Burkholderia sp. Bp9142]
MTVETLRDEITSAARDAGRSSDAAHASGTGHARRAAIAGWIGSALEYYDFFIYGTVAALVFPQLFFPPGDIAAATLASMATFGVAYAARPLGSFLMGHFGDRLGRKVVMVGTLLLMGISTFLVGCLPTYQNAGLLAPALLVTLRFLQGISASGELAGASSMCFEHAPQHRRGYYTSWTLSGTQGGQVLAPAVVLPLAAFLPTDQFMAWGWRVPFWLSAIVVVVGLVVRAKLEETPAFENKAAHEKVKNMPLKVLFASYRKELTQIFFTVLLASVGTTFAVFALSFSRIQSQPISTSTMLWTAALANLLAVFTIPVWGALSDRVGRRPVLVAGNVLCAIGLVFFLWSITTGHETWVLCFGVFLGGLAYGMNNAVYPALFGERFSTEVRMSGVAVGTQLGVGVAGFAPLIESALMGRWGTQPWVLPAVFAATVCLISSVAALTMREAHTVPLEQLGRREKQG